MSMERDLCRKYISNCANHRSELSASTSPSISLPLHRKYEKLYNERISHMGNGQEYDSLTLDQNDLQMNLPKLLFLKRV